MSNESTSSSGIGLSGVLFAIFLTLKLAEVGPVADWSWWWVTAPLWLGLAIVLGLTAIGASAVGVIAVGERIFRGKTVRLK